MHVLFIHPNFPTQFGQAAFYLTTQMGWQCTYVTSIDTTALKLPFNHLNYRVYDGPQPKIFTNPENLQGLLDHLMAVYRGLRGLPQVQPDLVVGHMSYGTMLYLKNLYKCPFVGFYEMLPPAFWSDDLNYRKEFPVPEGVRLFNATYHALTHLHMNAVDAIYTPTNFQKQTAPVEWQHKFKVMREGVDCTFFQRKEMPRPLEFRGVRIGPETRVVTYVSPGLESVRGFDIFMKAARIIAKEAPDTLFLIAGDERTVYGHELFHIGQQSFKQWVLGQDQYDLSRFHFLGFIPPDELAKLYSLSDVHIYLTVPHLISTSLIQALASECVVVGSATAPVQEFIENGVNGLLTDFYDHAGLAARTVKALKDRAAVRPLGQEARRRIMVQCEVRKCLTDMAHFFQGFRSQVGDDLFAAMGQGAPPSGLMP
jgi:glycosyltransferase involved in cell wall biosynthesis